MTISASGPSGPQTPSRKVVTSLWILLAASVCSLLLVKLVQLSFYFDGGIYAGVARNMAEGVGSAWSPYFSQTLFPVFAEHPPFMMWVESLGFMVFGDTIAVEKSFSLLTFAVAGVLLFKMWMRLHDGDVVMQRAAPIALFMVLIAGRMKWGFANGMLENQLIIFTLSAVLLIVTAYDRRLGVSSLSRVSLIACAGLAISLAVFTKGPVGLFPLATPAIYWFCFRRPSFAAVVLDSLILVAIVVLLFLVLWSFDASREATQRYLAAQLLPSLAGDRGNFGGGLSAVRNLIGVNGYSFAITALVLVVFRRWNMAVPDAVLRKKRMQSAAFLLLVGCSASFPILASPRVTNFYFNPSLPYFSTGFCVLCAPVLLGGLSRLGERWQNRLWIASSVFLAASVVIVGLNFGRMGGDKRVIENASAIAEAVCGASKTACRQTVSACGKVWEDWPLHTYLQRYYKVSMAPEPSAAIKYLVADESCQLDSTYAATGVKLFPYRLLQH